MCKVKRVKSALIFPVIEEVLEQGGTAWITVTGMSMYPFLREDIDSVELCNKGFDDLKRGDIVLIRRISGEYILHRVLKKEHKEFYMIGDAQQWIEGPLKPNQLIAAVSTVRRGKHLIKCNNALWRLLSKVWLNLIPIRHYFIKGLRVYSRLSHMLR